MILYLLSTCPVFLEGYAFALSKKIRNITWKSFTDPAVSIAKELEMPSAFLIKPVGFGNTNKIIDSVRSRYPDSAIVGVMPPSHNQTVKNYESQFDYVVTASEQIDSVVPKIIECLRHTNHDEDTLNDALDTVIFSVFDKYKYLNKRDIELLRALSVGNTVKEIGIDLGIPYRTLEGHVSKLKKHFGISKKSEFKNLVDTLKIIGYK